MNQFCQWSRHGRLFLPGGSLDLGRGGNLDAHYAVLGRADDLEGYPYATAIRTRAEFPG
jgi:hypothetical protein